MTKVILYIAASLDGFIAGADGSVGWLDPYNEVDCGYDEFLNGVGSLIMGSRTYEQLETLGPWPYRDLPAYVLTERTLRPMEGARIVWAKGDVRPVADRARRDAAGKDVWLVGGSDTAARFLAASLVDEIMLFVVPLLLGDGIPLFRGGRPGAPAELLGQVWHRNGMMRLHYALRR